MVIGSHTVKADLLVRENPMKEDHQEAILMVTEVQNLSGRKKNGQDPQTGVLATGKAAIATDPDSQDRMAMVNLEESMYMKGHRHAQEASFREGLLMKEKSRTWNMLRNSH